MSEFDDLFDRGIPREVALEFVDELLKLAVSMNWVHKAVTKASKDAPADRLLEVAGRNARGATAAASAGNSDAVKKRLLVKNKALGEALHRGQKAAALKEAVSTEWVARTARTAVRDAGPARAKEVGKGTMKNVLNAVKNKAPQASVDKRMALHHAVTSPQRLSVGSVSSAPMRKAAAVLAKYARPQPSREERQGPAPEQIILQEQQGQVAQTTAENQALRSELDAVQGASQENAQAAEQAGMMAQQGQEELQAAQQQGEELQMQAADAMAQAQQAQTEAQVHAQEAAQQADAKMRISIRLQQMRQQMADMASTDPVAEEGEAVDPIQTATQQGGGTPEEQAALEQQAAAEGGDPAADPAAAGDAPPAESAPPAKKPAPKAKAESKEKSEPPKTEIKVGSSNTYMKELAGRLAQKGGGKDLTAAAKKVSPSVAKAFSDVGTHAGMQLQKRAAQVLSEALRTSLVKKASVSRQSTPTKQAAATFELDDATIDRLFGLV